MQMYYTRYEYTVKLLVSCALYNFVGGWCLCPWRDGRISAS